MHGEHLHHDYIDGPRLFGVIPTPADGSNAWAAGVAGAQTKYTQGIQNTTKDQAGLAVAAQAKALANYAQALQSGEWARRLQARGTSYWRSQSLALASRYGSSGTTGKANYQAAASQLYPFEQQLQQQIDQARAQGATPIQLVQMWMDGMAQFKQQYTP
jgi:hypothetical protein